MSVRPRNYQKYPIKSADLLRELKARAGQWVSLTELTGLLSDKITPEAAVRLQLLSGLAGRAPQPMWMQIQAGKRRIVTRIAGQMARSGRIDRRPQNGTSEPEYRWTERNGCDEKETPKAR